MSDDLIIFYNVKVINHKRLQSPIYQSIFLTHFFYISISVKLSAGLTCSLCNK